MSACIATKVFTKNGNYFIKSYVMCDRHYGSEIRQIVFDWDHKISATENHKNAARTLAKKLNWDGEWWVGDAGNEYIWTRKSHNISYNSFTIPEEEV